jgi:DNA-binding SARP family transcriptional activator
VHRAVLRAARLAKIDPLDDEVQRTLLLVYLRAGRRTAAIRHYRQVRAQRLRLLGEEPAFDLPALAAAAADESLRVSGRAGEHALA